MSEKSLTELLKQVVDGSRDVLAATNDFEKRRDAEARKAVAETEAWAERVRIEDAGRALGDEANRACIRANEVIAATRQSDLDDTIRYRRAMEEIWRQGLADIATAIREMKS